MAILQPRTAPLSRKRSPYETNSWGALSQDTAQLFGQSPFASGGGASEISDGFGYPVPGGTPTLEPDGGWTPIDPNNPGGYPAPPFANPTPNPGPQQPTATAANPAYADGITLPPEWSYDPFNPTSFEDAMNSPGYQFRLNQGLGAIRNQNAAGGELFSPNTVKGLQDYAQNSASAEYDKVYSRDFDRWKANLGLSEAEYDRLVDRSVLNRQATTEDRAFSFGREMWDKDNFFREREYQTGDQRWQQEFTQRKDEYMRDDAYRNAVYASDYEYRKYRDQVDDQYKRDVMDEQRRQFLASLGAK